MAEVPMDTCNSCEKAYAITIENAVLNLFLTMTECNNIMARCPHCNFLTRIFVSIESCMMLISDLPIYVFPEPPADVVEGWKRCHPEAETPNRREGDEGEPVVDELPFVSERELKKLARDIDAFEHGVDG